MDYILQNFDKIYSILVLLVGSLFIKITLNFAKQTWSETFSHTTTIFLLPIIAYVITSVISGNIALSLGMIGALSIVRFRNPVRSPFELTLYFYSITLGISASVSIKWLIFLIIIVNLVIYTLILLDLIIKKFNNTGLFKVSFSEGNSQPTLEVRSSTYLDDLFNSDDLINYTSHENEHIFILCSPDIEKLKNYINISKKSGNKTYTNLKI